MITLTLAIVGGLISGALASRIPFTEKFFDDSEHFVHVDFDDDLKRFATEYPMKELNKDDQ